MWICVASYKMNYIYCATLRFQHTNRSPLPPLINLAAHLDLVVALFFFPQTLLPALLWLRPWTFGFPRLSVSPFRPCATGSPFPRLRLLLTKLLSHLSFGQKHEISHGNGTQLCTRFCAQRWTPEVFVTGVVLIPLRASKCWRRPLEICEYRITELFLEGQNADDNSVFGR